MSGFNITYTYDSFVELSDCTHATCRRFLVRSSSMQRSRVTCRAAAVSVLGLLWVVTAAFACPERCRCGSGGWVYCGGRGLTVVPANIPLGTTVLRLDHNNIQNLSDFSYLISLERPYLYTNDIRGLPAGVLSQLTSLWWLDLSDNHIADLPDGVFSHLTSLRYLWLFDNHIAHLPEGVFSNLTSLQGLDLSDNHIADLPDGVFSHLTSLRYLWLFDNHIAHLPEGVFSNLTSLQGLDLSDNHIADLPDGVFSHLTSLRYLWLFDNHIAHLPEGVFSNLTSLQGLDLSDNHIADLPDGVFSHLTSLKWIRLHNNNISSLPTGVFSHLTTLRDLYLSGNHIADLPDGVFSHLTSLEQLYMFNNNITSLPTGVFSHLTSLQGLSLSDNHIADLPDGVFSHLTSLEWLKLSNNNISSLPTGVFSHLTRLDELNLDNNNISSLPTGVFSHLTSLQELYIAGNPWRCDCSLYGVMTSTRLRGLIEDDPTCSSPPHMVGVALSSVTVDKVCQSRGDCTTGSADGTCACNVRWTGPFCEKEDNLALGKKVLQSSTDGIDAGAEKAVDGSTKNFAATELEYEPWWQVDLAGYYKIRRVNITANWAIYPFFGTFLLVTVRSMTCFTGGKLMLRVGPNEDFTQNDQCGQTWVKSGYQLIDIVEAHCAPPMYGRYVSVQAIPPVGTTSLVLSEVEVYSTGICCDITTEIMNGLVNANDGYCFGNEIQFSCNPGYELVGRSSATCEDDGSLGQLPTCQLSPAIIGGTSIVAAMIVGAVFFFLRRREDDQQPIELDFQPDDVARTTEGSPKYDVFISYSSKESPWVSHRCVCQHKLADSPSAGTGRDAGWDPWLLRPMHTYS
uniref:Sushi domain-containing protein n=1 Tax=Branchiostoma floridae TaxID=7739 RepID=C3ZRR4_BRAFL|eukprot:XP_002588853.1 hypothetical protein BRAFLDRAFT_99565 [Branchiostoma floridae]